MIKADLVLPTLVLILLAAGIWNQVTEERHQVISPEKAEAFTLFEEWVRQQGLTYREDEVCLKIR